MNLLYIVVDDNINYHLQAAFSIYSFLDKKAEIDSINVITDSPEFYIHLKEFVRVINVDQQMLKDWKGRHDFFWRVKIKGLELVCEMYEGPVVYLDTDTFLFGEFDLLRTSLSRGSALMHEREVELSKGPSKTEKRMWASVGNKTFGAVNIHPSHFMWNAGVVATPNIKAGEGCRLALAICDEMLDSGVTKRLIEQFALAVALHEVYGLQEAKKCIAHYWSNKDGWNTVISEFFNTAYVKGYSSDEIVALVKGFDFSKIPLNKRTPSIIRKVGGLMKRFFPDRDVSYLGGNT